MDTKVTLISHTADPMATLYKIWMENRDPRLSMTVQDVKDTVPECEVERIFKALIKSDISVIQNIHFTFKIENMSIALREQLVRHRIGVNLDGRVGVDYVPDLAEDGIWIQSMRVLDMGSFYDNNKFEALPAAYKDNEKAKAAYENCMRMCQETYKALCREGLPREAARMVLPLACQHDMFWTLNLGALCHILKKRGCWIPQFGLWRPIIVGIVDELATKIHPVFRELTQPPCVCNGRFTGCHFPEDTARRLDHSDPLPPCPIASSSEEIARWKNNEYTVETVTDADKALFDQMSQDYDKLWGYSSREELEEEIAK